MSCWVYILASRPGGTLYIGVTNNLIRRMYKHRNGLVPGFTKRYGVKRLVYFEEHATAPLAIQREKNIKHWPREWKIDLIVSMNPDWRDLYDEIASRLGFVMRGLDPRIHQKTSLCEEYGLPGQARQ